MQINRSTFGILFYLNTSKTKKSGKCPIVGRITVDGKSTTFSTGLDVLPEQWDAKSGLAVGKSKEVNGINQEIEKYRTETEEHYKTLVSDNGYVTAEALKNALRGIGLNQHTVMQEYVSLVEEKRKSIGIRIEASTYPVYPTALSHFKDFLREKTVSMMFRSGKSMLP